MSHIGLIEIVDDSEDIVETVFKSRVTRAKQNGGVRGAAQLHGKSRHDYCHRHIHFIVIATILLGITSCALLYTSLTRTCLQEEFDARVRQLIRNVTVSQERLQMLPRLLRAVEDTLNQIWPGCEASLLGSLAVGLGSPSSDADIAVHLPHGEYTSDKDVVHRAAIAFENSPHYQQINIIESKRISVINLHYTPADISCDISLKTVVAPYETELMKYLLHSDERFLKMSIIIKHWAKIQRLTVKMVQSSFNILLLVVFFLQERSLLPAVVELQKNVRVNILNGSERFNVAFERKAIMSDNSDSLSVLLGEFFVYYSEFDFDKYIVSTYTGQPLERRAFEDLESLPDEFSLYKINVENNVTYPLNIKTALCIQAPLTHNNNCAYKVDGELKARMELSFKYAAKLYRENDMCRFFTAVF